VRGRRLRQPGDAGIGHSDADAAPVYVSWFARPDLRRPAIDATGYTRTRTVRLCHKLTDAQISARTAELCQAIEVAQGETKVFDEIGSELAHQGGVRADECQVSSPCCVGIARPSIDPGAPLRRFDRVIARAISLR